ncbi:hypothetical protein HPB52_004070 [Rhipicephalus sanguineus]|uniref:Uncharacterized protein n=1 Tax=Rhipicephalus sanguineus TaxID=34632 RepID=A0A9D4PUH2_RHISA|nr:hypothetical protein HPB52_004070 [Rhipicephalus sanguineus]
MLPRLCPPVQPFHPAYPRAWFWQLDACLAVNGVTAQPLMHDILLDALPAELRHLSAASSSSPQPYDDLCAAVLARYGETYRPLPGTRELRVSPPPTRAVPPGSQPSHDHDLPSPATSLSTSRPATSAAVPAPDDQPDDVQVPTPELPGPDDVPAAIDQSATRCVSSTSSADGPSGMPAIRPSSLSSPAHDTSLTSASTLATLPPELEADTDNLSPTVRPSLAEVSPSTVPEHDFSPTSKLCASCQQRPASPSTSTAAEVRAPYQLRPHLRDAATMTEVPEDGMPAGSPMAEQAAHVTPARCHRRFAPEPLTQDAAHLTCGHCAGALCRHPRQRCARTGKTHRSSYSPMVARRGFTVPFRIVSRTSPAPAPVHPPSTPSAGTSASRADSRHPVRYRKAPSSRRGTRLGTTPAYFRPVLRPLRFSQNRPPETQGFPIVLHR